VFGAFNAVDRAYETWWQGRRWNRI